MERSARSARCLPGPTGLAVRGLRGRAPKETPPVPKTLNWDMWLGLAPYRPYNPIYAPFKWRGWCDFGTGALGDMGCHVLDPVFRALKLGHPTSVMPSVRISTAIPILPLPPSITNSRASDMPPVKLTWYDGGRLPDRPAELEAGRRMPKAAPFSWAKTARSSATNTAARRG